MARSLFIIALLLGTEVPASAEPVQIEVAEDEDWVHAPTGLRFPVRIGDTQRDRILSFLAGENNIGATYIAANDDSNLSIYAYRSGSYDVSMMADAAIAAISGNEKLGSIDREEGNFTTFGDATIGENSGVLDTFAVEGTFRSTGVALFRVGDWLIKLRLSSKSIDADTLDTRLMMLASGLPINPPKQKAPVAYRVPACADVPPRPLAERRELDLTDWIIATTAISLSYDDDADKEVVSALTEETDSVQVCRDSESRPGRMLYRDGTSGDPVAIVFGDSGTVAHVDGLGLSLQEGQSPAIALSLGNGMRTDFYQGFETTPGFEQIMDVFETDPVMASVERTEEGSSISLPLSE